MIDLEKKYKLSKFHSAKGCEIPPDTTRTTSKLSRWGKDLKWEAISLSNHTNKCHRDIGDLAGKVRMPLVHHDLTTVLKNNGACLLNSQLLQKFANC